MRRLLTAALLLLGAAPAAQAATCDFTAPAGTAYAIALDLPKGAQDVRLGIGASRPLDRLSSPESWHLAAAVAIVNRATLQVVAHRVVDDGSGPPNATVGLTLPVRHGAQLLVPDLPRGRYAVVAFGVDGDRALPNPEWSATLQTDRPHSCAPATAALFEYDASDFGGSNTQLLGVAAMDGATVRTTLPRRLVVGFTEAFGGPGATAKVDLAAPAGAQSAREEIRPFASRGGPFTWTATTTGFAGAVLAAGVAVDLPCKKSKLGTCRA